MKTLTKYLNEKLVINKSYKDSQSYTCAPKTFNELRKIINDRYNKLGPGTKNNPIDFNDVDVSNIDSFCNINEGIFDGTKFEYIAISYWNASNVKNMSNMFYNCKQLKYIGDLSNWNVSNVKSMNNMFEHCEQLKSVGDLSNWDVSKVNYMNNMFDNSGIINIPKWYKK